MNRPRGYCFLILFLNMASRNVGAIYITNDNFCQGQNCAVTPNDFNPFDTLPTYFDELALRVRQINNPVPSPSSLLLMCLGAVAMLGSGRKYFR
jgi:hypothetical protein